MKSRTMKPVGLISRIRYSKVFRGSLILLSFLLLLPYDGLYALTSGPSMPEYSGFQAVTPGEHVDPFSGNFTYTIPLGDVDGQLPLTLVYSSGAVSWEGEASWVGLGWNLNTGAINRQVNGVPDDAKGDKITRYIKARPERQIWFKAKFKPEFFGTDISKNKLLKFLKLGVGIGLSNYKGLMFSTSSEAIIPIGKADKSVLVPHLSLSYSYTTKKGPEFLASLGTNLERQIENSKKASYSSTLSLSITPSSYSMGAGFASTYTGYKEDDDGNSEKYRSSAGVNVMLFKAGESFGMVPYYNIRSLDVTANATLGFTLFGAEMQGGLYVNFKRFKIVSKTYERPVFGFLFLHKGQTVKHALLDYIREKDVSYVEGKPIHTPTYLSPDVFSVSAPGMTLSFLPERKHWSYVFTPAASSISAPGETSKPGLKSVFKYLRDALKSFASSIGFEGDGGNLFKGGINISLATSRDEQGTWEEVAEALPKFKGNDVYFKIVNYGGEVDDQILNSYNITGYKAYDVPIKLERKGIIKVGPKGDLPPKIETVSDPSTGPISITSYSVSEAQQIFGTSYSDVAKPYHIGRIEIVNSGGIRYVFGRSLYNRGTNEITFRKSNDDKGGVPFLISYSHDDASDKNKQGKDHFFEQVKRPPYAYAYLLTEVYSSDYVDRTGDGPTDDDLGWWAKYDYSLPYLYTWRTPVDRNKAYYSPGKLADKKDGVATFTYGVKEISFLRSIESPFSYIVFHTSPRDDGLSVIDQHGGVNANSSARLHRLDSISFYQKDPGGNKYIYRKVFFNYDYSLAQGSPNSIAPSKGRLTLKSITIVDYDIYGGYETGRRSYAFNYYNTYNGQVVKYEPGKVDRWGIYKPDVKWDNKYATNDTSERNQAVSLWKLMEVTLPSGAKIKIKYESDRYSWVQNKRAQMMYKILGFSKNKIDSPGRFLISDVPHLYMHVDAIPDTIQDYLKAKKYADFILEEYSNKASLGKYVYIKAKASIKNAGLLYVNDLTAHEYDYVEVFVPFESYDVVFRNNKYYLVIKTKPKQLNALINVNFITWFAIQKAILQYPDLVYPGIDKLMNDLSQKGVNIKSLTNALVNVVNTLFNSLSIIGGSNMRGLLLSGGVGVSVAPEPGFVRLGAPPTGRLGGGARVRKIIYEGFRDNVSQKYVTEYRYYLFDPRAEQMGHIIDWLGLSNTEITSGVAAFEPIIGHEENPLMEPLFYSTSDGNILTSLSLLPSLEFFVTKPVMLMSYPSAGIGYKNVVVKNVSPPGVIGIGEVRYEYYTYKEYPIMQGFSYINKDNETMVSRKNLIMLDIELIPFIPVENDIYISQSFYSVEHNMHGKIKRKTVYDGMGQFVAQSVYYYKSSVPLQRFKNYQSIDFANEKGEINSHTPGVDIDFVVDMGYYKSSSDIANAFFNIDMFSIIFAVVTVPFPWANARIKRTRHGFVTTTTKVKIDYFIDYVEVRKKNQIAKKYPMLYDSLTREVIATKSMVGTQVKDSLYQVRFPAYWFYPELGPKSRKEGRYFDISTNNLGQISQFSFIAAKDNVFIPPETSLSDGDQFFDPQPKELYWVARNEIDAKLYIIDKNGHVVPSFSGQLIRIRSGKKNMLGIASATASSIDLPIKHINNKEYLYLDDNSRVLSASLTTLSDHWQIDCDVDPICVYNSDNNYDTITKTYELRFGFKEKPTRGNFAHEVLDINDSMVHALHYSRGSRDYISFNIISNWYNNNGLSYAVDTPKGIIAFERINDDTVLYLYASKKRIYFANGKSSFVDSIWIVQNNKFNSSLLITPPQDHYITLARVLKDNITGDIYLAVFHTYIPFSNICNNNYNVGFFISIFKFEVNANNLLYIGSYNYHNSSIYCISIGSGDSLPNSKDGIHVGDVSIDNGYIAFGYYVMNNWSSIGKSIYYFKEPHANLGLINVNNPNYLYVYKTPLAVMRDISVSNGKVYIIGAKVKPYKPAPSVDTFRIEGRSTFLAVYDLNSMNWDVYDITAFSPMVSWFVAFRLIRSKKGLHIMSILDNKGPAIAITEPIDDNHDLTTLKYVIYRFNHGNSCYHSCALNPNTEQSFYILHSSRPNYEAMHVTFSIQGSEAIEQLFPTSYHNILFENHKIVSHWPEHFCFNLFEGPFHIHSANVTTEGPSMLAKLPVVDNDGNPVESIGDIGCINLAVNNIFSPLQIKQKQQIGKQQLIVVAVPGVSTLNSNNMMIHRQLYNFNWHLDNINGSVSNIPQYNSPFRSKCGFIKRNLTVFIKHPEDCCDGEVSIASNDQGVINAFVYMKGKILQNIKDTGLCIGRYPYHIVDPSTGCELMPPGEFVLRYNSTCYGSADGVINPFLEGARGRWMVKDIWTQRLVRTPSDLNQLVDVKQHGYLENWKSFVKFDGKRVVLDTTGWVRQNTVTRVQPWGEPIEERNILGLYSSALYGYRHKFPVMTAVNARSSQIFFTSFEDSTVLSSHLRTVYPLPSDMWTQYRVADGHGGYWSLSITDSFSIGGKWIDQFCEYHDDKHAIPYVIDDCDCNPHFQPKPGEPLYYYVWVKWVRKDKKVKVCDGVIVESDGGPGGGIEIGHGNDPTERVSNSSAVTDTGKFRDKGNRQNEKTIIPEKGQISPTNNSNIDMSSIKVPAEAPASDIYIKPVFNYGGNNQNKPECQYVTVEAYDTPSIELTFSSEVLSPITYKPEWISRPVEGWVLYRFKVDIPQSSCGDYRLTLHTNKPVKIDDIRIEPLSARTRAIVYDWQRLRIVNEFGFNHFGTFYKYDERGNLTTILVETEEGKIGTGHQRSELKK